MSGTDSLTVVEDALRAGEPPLRAVASYVFVSGTDAETIPEMGQHPHLPYIARIVLLSINTSVLGYGNTPEEALKAAMSILGEPWADGVEGAGEAIRKQLESSEKPLRTIGAFPTYPVLESAWDWPKSAPQLEKFWEDEQWRASFEAEMAEEDQAQEG